MTSPFEAAPLKPRERADYGFARVRDIAFDAVKTLWRRRHQEGMKQTDLANAIGRDPAWVSRSLRAPGNWTLRTIGELVEALDGEVEIVVRGNDEIAAQRKNYDAYSEYERRALPTALEDGGQALDARGGTERAPALGFEGAAQIVT